MDSAARYRRHGCSRCPCPARPAAARRALSDNSVSVQAQNAVPSHAPAGAGGQNSRPGRGRRKLRRRPGPGRIGDRVWPPTAAGFRRWALRARHPRPRGRSRRRIRPRLRARGPKVTDLGGRGDTRVVSAPNPRKVLAETDGQQRRFGGDRRGEQSGLARDHPPPGRCRTGGQARAGARSCSSSSNCATGATDPDHAQPAGTRDRRRQRTLGHSPHRRVDNRRAQGPCARPLSRQRRHSVSSAQRR